ncbi:MAG: VTT domain-containing protein [Burkholderiaceae bacterium]
MTALESFATQHASWLLFFNVFFEQLGVPIPAYPSLLLAGALSLTAAVNTPGMVMFLGVVACLLADTIWYWAGRRYGSWMMGKLCRFSLTPDVCVSKNTGLYTKIGPRVLLVAKFLPGAGALSTLLAGATGTPLRQFLVYDTLGSALWVGSAVLIGIVFQDAITQILALGQAYLPWALATVVLAFALFLAWRWRQRHALLKRGRAIPRLSVDALARLMDQGDEVILLDVRAPELEGAPIPGAVRVLPDAALSDVPGLDSGRRIIVYCACPNEISAALLSEKIRATFRDAQTFALAGGYAAWQERAGRRVDGPGDLS